MLKDWILLALGLLALAAAYIVNELPETWLTSNSATFWHNILVGAGLAVATVGISGLTSSLTPRNRERNARLFFGDLVTSENEALVYPDFILSNEARERISDLSETSVYEKRSSHFAGSRFIDVPHIVASNDLIAMTNIATELGRYGQFYQEAVSDGRISDNHQRSFISFGLTSNAATQIYLGTDREPLFDIQSPQTDPKIVVTGGVKRSIDLYSDSQEARIKTKGGTSFKPIYNRTSLPKPSAGGSGGTFKFGRNKSFQHGIILRYRPEPIARPSRQWFICAGLAAAGTPAAAYLLATHWEAFHKTFGSDDFLVVFKTNNNVETFMGAEIVHTLTRS